ncbi:MAG: aspartate racemase [Planctomycetota bacterium]|nr:MAG: aspartate racemase [Planctomycetota bacterium]
MNRKSKKVGILGGKGPEATVSLFEKIIQHTPVTCEEDHLRIIIDNYPATPKPSLAINGLGDNPVDAMVEGAKLLELAGVDFIVMPCNSAHYYLNEVSDKVEVPFISIIEEAVKYAKNLSLKKIGILATKGLLESGLYQDSLKSAGLVSCVTSETNQQNLMNGILTYKDSGDATLLSDQMDINIEQLISKGADGVILGCTELPLIAKDKNYKIIMLDTLDILAKACVTEALKD